MTVVLLTRALLLHLRDGAAATFLCDGAAIAPSADPFLRDGAAAVPKFVGDGTDDEVAMLRVLRNGAADAALFVCDCGAAALKLLRVLPVAMFEHDDEK